MVSGPLWKGRILRNGRDVYQPPQRLHPERLFCWCFNHIRQSIYARIPAVLSEHRAHELWSRFAIRNFQKTRLFEIRMCAGRTESQLQELIPFPSIGYSKDNLNLAFSYRLNKYSPIYSMLQSSIDYDRCTSTGPVTLISSLRSSTGFNLSGQLQVAVVHGLLQLWPRHVCMTWQALRWGESS